MEHAAKDKVTKVMEEQEGRRGFVKKAAVLALGVGALSSTASAQQAPMPQVPDNTPITKMGLNQEEINMLTETAKKFDAKTLIDLQSWAQAESKRLGLRTPITVQDLASMEKAMHSFYQRTRKPDGSIASDTSCCCTCTPCCTCAVSVVRPLKVA